VAGKRGKSEEASINAMKAFQRNNSQKQHAWGETRPSRVGDLKEGRSRSKKVAAHKNATQEKEKGWDFRNYRTMNLESTESSRGGGRQH